MDLTGSRFAEFNRVGKQVLEQSDDLRARVRKILADAERILTFPRISLTNALDGRRERARTVNAVDASDEPDLHPDPRLLSAGGQQPHADQHGPQTEKCDTAREAGESRDWTGQVKSAGLNRDEFHNSKVRVPETES